MRPIICLGDSITGGQDLRLYLKWPGVLAAMLAARCGEAAPAVINCGIPGDDSGGMLVRLADQVLAARPSLVVLLGGGNDTARGIPRERTAANLAAIAAQVVAAGAGLLGLQYHLVVHPEAEDQAWRHLPANNDLLAAAVRAHGGRIVDTAGAMARAASAQPPAELVAPDAVHLNPGGELVYARAVFDALEAGGWLPELAIRGPATRTTESAG
ncbi:MAG: SGNH/GDSL hydrolase family protein [Planctomycetes bacterium]|nr:SGNH/GDSL hydrolase family protein [Planctomycetota bacterium]